MNRRVDGRIRFVGLIVIGLMLVGLVSLGFLSEAVLAASSSDEWYDSHAAPERPEAHEPHEPHDLHERHEAHELRERHEAHELRERHEAHELRERHEAHKPHQSHDLPLSEAIQRALERSTALTLARLTVAEVDIALQEAELGELIGRPRSEYDQAVQAVREARDDYTDQLVQVALQVEEAYYGVLRAGELLQIQESNQEQADRQFALTRARYDAGLIARQDFLEAEASHEQSRFGLERARRTYTEAMRQLARLVGLPDDAELQLTEQFVFEPWHLSLDEAIAEALMARTEVVRARRNVRQAESQLEQADAPYAAPVERRRAQIQLERARVQYEQAVAQVAENVRKEWFALKDAEHAVDVERRQEQLARTRAEIGRARYDAGTVALLDLLKSEASYAQARLDAAGAVWDYNLARARFLRTLGRSELPPLPPSIAEYIAGWDELD